MSGWARWSAILFATVQAILEVGVFPAFPLWSLVVIALNVVVIYQLTANWEAAR
jgi:type III secretory pathway component EscV